ncbi:MAG: hypothetical protein A3K22_04985 [Deltaproteobacteria bacterium RBG_16_42_7]|nr:MAG: hypothetical protein A3K22_04985 [Deltaproteobacteria bacterium RBG_16_42_7]
MLKKGDYMTIKKLIIELKNYGYDLYLDGGNIGYKFTALIEPPKERIAVLLDSLKRNKPEVISYLGAQESPNKALSPHDAGVDIHSMPLSDFEQAGLVLKVYSEVLQEHICFVSSDAVINRCNNLDAVSYNAQELTTMIDMTPEELKAVHMAKTVFHRARVISHMRVAS